MQFGWMGGIVLFAGAGMVSSASAQVFDDIAFWVGEGSNQAGFVIDWNDGISDESLMWGFRWDGAATGADMMTAIVSADARLFAHLSVPGSFGVSPYGIGYDADGDGVFGVTPTLSFDSFGLSTGSPFDGREAADADDHWQEGWVSDGYWSYWLGSGDEPAWEGAMTGMSDRVLTDGSWDAWSYAAGFGEVLPSMPVAAAVPAPGSLTLLGAGLLAARRRRRPQARTAR